MLLCPGVKCYERPINGFKREETSKNAVFFWAANGDVKNSVLIFTEIDHDTVELLGYVSDIEFIRD